MIDIKKIIASAIANARGMRRGAPSVTNILDILPPKLKKEVLDDAENIIRELSKHDITFYDTGDGKTEVQ